MANSKNDIMIYQDKDGITKENVKLIDDDIWLTQNSIASLYKIAQQSISLHINNKYKDGELQEI